MSETSLHKSITRVLSFSDTEPTGYPKNSTFLTSDMYTRYKMLQQFNNSVIICHSRDFECCWRSVVTFLCVNCSWCADSDFSAIYDYASVVVIAKILKIWKRCLILGQHTDHSVQLSTLQCKPVQCCLTVNLFSFWSLKWIFYRILDIGCISDFLFRPLWIFRLLMMMMMLYWCPVLSWLTTVAKFVPDLGLGFGI